MHTLRSGGAARDGTRSGVRLLGAGALLERIVRGAQDTEEVGRRAQHQFRTGLAELVLGAEAAQDADGLSACGDPGPDVDGRVADHQTFLRLYTHRGGAEAQRLGVGLHAAGGLRADDLHENARGRRSA